MIDFPSFLKIFDNSFWKVLSKSLVPSVDGEFPKNKTEFLEHLYGKIVKHNYSPSNPRDYIVLDKGNGVTRIVPTFNYADCCVYFYCIKMLEEKIAVNRVEGTFGGWTLGNPLRDQEEIEIPYGVSIPTLSFNRFAWGNNWKEFQKRAYEYSRLVKHPSIVKFDISHFYDSINLNALEKKIALVAGKEHSFEVDLLFNFLCNWNKRFEGYARKTVGLPQDELQDCSRILANLYLQDYDEFIFDKSNALGARYLRYADDQLIVAPSTDIADMLLAVASKELFKINLSLNSSKVVRFRSLEEFDTYWAFDIFKLLEKPYDYSKINQAVEMFFKWIDEQKLPRQNSVLKKFLDIDFSKLSPHLRFKLLSEVYKDDFLALTDIWFWKRILSNSTDKNELYSKLDALVPKVLFNSFHYNLIRFNKQTRPEIDNEYILTRIKELSVN